MAEGSGWVAELGRTAKMQIAGRLADTELKGATKGAHSQAEGNARVFRAIPRLVIRGCAFVIALASAAAIGIVAALSVGCYGAARIFVKVRPLREGYEFLSRAYGRFIDWLGRRILRDPRDAPALRIMVSLTLTALPIFIAQLVLGKLRIPLVIAFYLSLYGFKFQRFVRMFSAKHLEAHRRQGYFDGKYDKVLGRYSEFFLGYLYGNVPELDRTVHVRLHHKENSGPDDTTSTSGYDRTSRLDFLWYLTDNVGTVLGFTPYRYFKTRGDEENRKRMLWGMARYYAYFAAVFIYNWRIGLVYVLGPLLCMNFITAMTAWVQHAFYDPERPEDYFANTVTHVDEINFMNEGYHLCHHHRSGLHWTEMPSHFERIRDKMREAGSLVFRDLDVMELFLELTLLRRMDVLAEKLIPWDLMSHEERVGLLEKRTRPSAAHPG